MKAFEEKLIYTGASRILVDGRVEDKFVFEWHYHDAYEITLILKGDGQRFVGDSIEAYKEGDLVCIPPDLAHTWKSSLSSIENEAIYIQFDRNCFGEGTFEVDDFRELHELLNSEQGFVFEYHEAMQNEFKECLHSEGLDRVISFFKLLKNLLSLKNSPLASVSYETKKDEESRKTMDKLMNLISKNKMMNVPDIASELSMSESTFRRFIKKNTGRSFIDFLNLIKISQACQLILSTRKSISEIALECGYKNLSHFNRKFKEYKKLSPKTFRNSYS